MTLSGATKITSPFSEIRQLRRERILFVVAGATASATTLIVTTALLVIGATA